MLIIDLILDYLLIIRLQIKTLIYKNPPQSWNKGEKGDVVLISGIFTTWVFLKTIGDFLNKQGFRVHIIPNLRRNTIPLEKGILLSGEYLVKQNFKNLILIGYSKGGLIVRALLNDPRYNHAIKKVFTISTPFNGTIAGFLWLFNLHELTPGFPKLKKISSEHDSNIVNIYPSFDNHVIPTSSLLLPRGKNIQIPIVGHARILESKKTREVVKLQLEE